jgi:uncharacterized membrane protein YphA (DoxX/SURF4 family)
MERQSMTMDRAVQVRYFLLRIVAGLLFVQTGVLILFGWFGGIPRQPGTSPLMSQTGIGGVLEFFGGIAIALGLGTRPVASILSGMMAVAYSNFMHRMACHRFRIGTLPPSYSVSSSCTWPRGAGAIGASMR